MIELKIDPEFRDKIPPLTDAEFEQLRENILTDGEVYEPIAIWNETIVDGHNRWKIILDHPDIPYRTREMHFSDKWEAFDWMYKKQLGRRNLTEEQRTVLTGKMYEARMHTVSNPMGTNQYTKEVGSQNGSQPKEKTRVSEQIAEELGVGKNTVLRAHKFSKGIDKLKEIAPEAADKVLQGGSGVTKSTIMALPKMEPEEQQAVAKSIVENKPVQPPKKKPVGRTTEMRKANSLIDDVYSSMLDTSTPSEYGADDLIEEIEINAKAYVDQLRRTLAIRNSVFAEDKTRDRVRASIDGIIESIKKVRDLV